MRYSIDIPIDGDIIKSKTEFVDKVCISANTIAKLSRNEIVSMDVIIKICCSLECSVEDNILPKTKAL